MNFKEKIIDYILRNRVSTTEVADCMDKTGALVNIFPLNRGHFKVGEVFWAYAYNESNWECHEQLRDVKENDIVLVEAFDCNDRAVFGALVSKFLLLYRQASAIVVQGNLRDTPWLIKENWPIWLESYTPIGCFNTKNKKPFDSDLLSARKKRYDGAIAVCDDCGVVIITKQYHNQDFLNKLSFIEEQEDIWFECIDRKKWDTFETVCLKNYLNDQ